MPETGNETPQTWWADLEALKQKAIEETIPNELINFCIETEPFFFDWIKSKTV